MKTIACVLFFLTTALVSAQTLYKWVDAQGKISYSDQPPPPNQQVKDLSKTVNTLGAGEAQAETLSFETQQLAQRSPVVIYTSQGCGPCDQGRSFLKNKNIPFLEKTISGAADLKALGTQFNSQSLPVLTIGSANINGFGSSQWNDALLNAGYKDSPPLPKTYVNGIAKPLTAPMPNVQNSPKVGDAEAPTQLPLRTRSVTPNTSNTSGTAPIIKF